MKLSRHLSLTVLISFSYFFSYAQDNLSAVKLDKPLVIDGFLEAEWFLADSIGNFIQLEPDKGSASTRKTIVRAAQYNEDLSLSFTCFINEHEQIAARIQRRDQGTGRL